MCKKDYPEILAEMVASLAAVLVKHGLDAISANEAAMSATESVRSVFAGQLLYIPRGLSFDISERDEKIYALFDGKNISELAKKFNLSVQHVYRILAKCRASTKSSNQPQFKKGTHKCSPQ